LISNREPRSVRAPVRDNSWKLAVSTLNDGPREIHRCLW
jgi:hypothetical protein